MSEMIILGIDPGPTSSAAVLWNTKSEEVKASWTDYFCGSRRRVKTSNINAVLLSRYKKGTKKQPGPLYGVKGHEMSALAAAIYWWEGTSL